MRLRPGGLWRDPEFLKFLAGNSIDYLGSQVSLLAIPLAAVLTLQADAQEMGFLRFAGSIPNLLLALFVGVRVDRRRRLPLMIAANVASCFVLGSIPVAAIMGRVSFTQLYTVAFLAGALGLVALTSQSAYVPSLVGRKDLVEANSKNAVSISVAQIIGPNLAGILIQALTAPIAVAVDAISFLISAALFGLIRRPEPHPTHRSVGSRIATEVWEGLRLVATHPVLRAVVISAGTFNLFASFNFAVYFLYAVKELHVTPVALGLILAASGPGVLLGSLLAARSSRVIGIGATIIIGVLAVGVGRSVVPIVSGPLLLVTAVLVAGEFSVALGIALANINLTSVRQAITPDKLQGRVSSSMLVVTSGAVPIGALLGGLAGTHLGLRATLWVGVAGMLSGLVWLLLSPIRTMRETPATLDI